MENLVCWGSPRRGDDVVLALRFESVSQASLFIAESGSKSAKKRMMVKNLMFQIGLDETCK